MVLLSLEINVFFILPFSPVPHFLLRSRCWSLQQSGEVLPGLSSPGDLILSYSIFHLSFDDWSSHHHQYCWYWPQSGQPRGQRRAKEEWTNIDQEELGCVQNTQKTNKADKWNNQTDKIKANLVVEMDAQWTKCQSHLPLQGAHPLLQPTATVLQASNKLEDEMSESNKCKIVSGWASQVATNAKGVCAQIAGTYHIWNHLTRLLPILPLSQLAHPTPSISLPVQRIGQQISLWTSEIPLKMYIRSL